MHAFEYLIIFFCLDILNQIAVALIALKSFFSFQDKEYK